MDMVMCADALDAARRAEFSPVNSHNEWEPPGGSDSRKA
jgi:hypothetical protein